MFSTISAQCTDSSVIVTFQLTSFELFHHSITNFCNSYPFYRFNCCIFYLIHTLGLLDSPSHCFILHVVQYRLSYCYNSTVLSSGMNSKDYRHLFINCIFLSLPKSCSSLLFQVLYYLYPYNTHPFLGLHLTVFNTLKIESSWVCRKPQQPGLFCVSSSTTTSVEFCLLVSISIFSPSRTS